MGTFHLSYCKTYETPPVLKFSAMALFGGVDVKYLFSTFNRDEFWGIFKCMFITNIKNFLWYLLLLIPGIIKSY